jgi:hypothetical protein
MLGFIDACRGGISAASVFPHNRKQKKIAVSRKRTLRKMDDVPDAVWDSRMMEGKLK